MRVAQPLPLPEFVSFNRVFGTEGPRPLVSDEPIQDITFHQNSEVTETIVVEAAGNIVDTASTMTSRRGSRKKTVEELPVIGANLQNVLTTAPGITDSDGNRNVHGARDTGLQTRTDGGNMTDPASGVFGQYNADFIEELEAITSGVSAEFGRADGGFANIVTRSGSHHASEKDLASALEAELHLEALSLRVLADLADDQTLTRSEGIPALAGLVAAQHVNGGISRVARIHELVTWALAEAAGAAPDLPWVRDALWRAREFVLDPGAPYRCSVVRAPAEAAPAASFPVCAGPGSGPGEDERDTTHEVALLLPASNRPESMRLVSRIVSGLAGRRLCGDLTED